MRSSTLRSNQPDDSSRLVHVPVRPEAIQSARRAIRHAARAAGLGGDRIDDLMVAVSEACTNALEAQLAAGVTDPIEVSCQVEDDLFEVLVRDHGRGFRPDDLPARPPVSDPRHLDVERGWGIQLMAEFVDELVFDLTGPGTVVCLRMQLG
jgi:serine/threonine-protein kinase RsbW